MKKLLGAAVAALFVVVIGTSCYGIPINQIAPAKDSLAGAIAKFKNKFYDEYSQESFIKTISRLEKDGKIANEVTNFFSTLVKNKIPPAEVVTKFYGLYANDKQSFSAIADKYPNDFPTTEIIKTWKQANDAIKSNITDTDSSGRISESRNFTGDMISAYKTGLQKTFAAVASGNAEQANEHRKELIEVWGMPEEEIDKMLRKSILSGKLRELIDSSPRGNDETNKLLSELGVSEEYFRDTYGNNDDAERAAISIYSNKMVADIVESKDEASHRPNQPKSLWTAFKITSLGVNPASDLTWYFDPQFKKAQEQIAELKRENPSLYSSKLYKTPEVSFERPTYFKKKYEQETIELKEWTPTRNTDASNNSAFEKRIGEIKKFVTDTIADTRFSEVIGVEDLNKLKEILDNTKLTTEQKIKAYAKFETEKSNAFYEAREAVHSAMKFAGVRLKFNPPSGQDLLEIENLQKTLSTKGDSTIYEIIRTYKGDFRLLLKARQNNNPEESAKQRKILKKTWGMTDSGIDRMLLLSRLTEEMQSAEKSKVDQTEIEKLKSKLVALGVDRAQLTETLRKNSGLDAMASVPINDVVEEIKRAVSRKQSLPQYKTSPTLLRSIEFAKMATEKASTETLEKAFSGEGGAALYKAHKHSQEVRQKQPRIAKPASQQKLGRLMQKMKLKK
ncbi:hypothetical protein HOD08_04290 [bacterium]|nr:hypothetical protein [bacterium]